MGGQNLKKQARNVSINVSLKIINKKKIIYQSLTFKMGGQNLKKKPRNVSVNVSLNKINKKIYFEVLPSKWAART